MDSYTLKNITGLKIIRRLIGQIKIFYALAYVFIIIKGIVFLPRGLLEENRFI